MTGAPDKTRIATVPEGRAQRLLHFGRAVGEMAAGAVAIGVLAYACLMKAMRTGDVSTVTPFRYTRLLFGVALGVAVFDERIDGPMLAGCAIIVGAGLAIAWDGRRRRA